MWKKFILFVKTTYSYFIKYFYEIELMFSAPPSADCLPETVILVDEYDREIGHCEKMLAHQQALLHRAFSIFIFRATSHGWELLLQQRAAEKYHSAFLWTNSCCGHPRKGEDIYVAASRRLFEELGFTVPLKCIDAFIYKIAVNSELTEHEYDHVFYGFADDNIDIPFNPNEVQDIQWKKITELQMDMQQNPDQYTVWFPQALDMALQKLDSHSSVQPAIYGVS